jgi:hypothetical protein
MSLVNMITARFAHDAAPMSAHVAEAGAAGDVHAVVDAATRELAGHAGEGAAALGHTTPGAGHGGRAQARAAERMLDRIAPVSDVTSQRAHEVPYGMPEGFDVLRVPLGAPLPVHELDPTRAYLWVLDDAGTMHVAPEVQQGFGVTAAHPEGRAVKHGDLTPTPDGQRRAPARLGGALTATSDASGGARWTLDNNSSYTFSRARIDADGSSHLAIPLGGTRRLHALRNLLATDGTDVSSMRVRNMFNPVAWLQARASGA